MVSMSELFLLMHERGASDLHLTVGAPPILRDRRPARPDALREAELRDARRP